MLSSSLIPFVSVSLFLVSLLSSSWLLLLLFTYRLFLLLSNCLLFKTTLFLSSKLTLCWLLSNLFILFCYAMHECLYVFMSFFNWIISYLMSFLFSSRSFLYIATFSFFSFRTSISFKNIDTLLFLLTIISAYFSIILAFIISDMLLFLLLCVFYMVYVLLNIIDKKLCF